MMRVRKMIWFLLTLIIFSGNNLQAQSATLEPEPGFTEYATYYISSFDLQTGASNFQLFRFRLAASTYPVYCKLFSDLSFFLLVL